MRSRRLSLALLAALGPAAPASAVTIDWVTVGDPGNACDTQPQGCFGSVDYTYRIGKYEVTNTQYAEFLNAVAASDPYGLYNLEMGDPTFGGITRSGNSGSYTYAVESGFESRPVVWVSWFDTVRFANWMHNGMGAGGTEGGAYTLLGGTPTPSNATTVSRDPGATLWLPSEDEWYKAAYFDGATWFDYPAGSDTQTTCELPPGGSNSANCWPATSPDGALTNVGAYTGSASPYGTFDQGGNVLEWNETDILGDGSNRGDRGGAWGNLPGVLAVSSRPYGPPTFEILAIGFRVASAVPEPGTGLLVTAGVLGLVGWRWRCG